MHFSITKSKSVNRFNTNSINEATQAYIIINTYHVNKAQCHHNLRNSPFDIKENCLARLLAAMESQTMASL